MQKVYVHDLQRRVGRRFQIDGLRVRAQGLLHGVQIGHVDEGHVDAVAGQAVVHEGEGAAVQRFAGYEVAALLQKGPQGRGNSAHARAGGHAGFRAFQQGDFFFGDGAGRVSQAAVNVAVFLQGKAAAALGGRVEDKGRRLIDRGG